MTTMVSDNRALDKIDDVGGGGGGVGVRLAAAEEAVCKTDTASSSMVSDSGGLRTGGGGGGGSKLKLAPPPDGKAKHFLTTKSCSSIAIHSGNMVNQASNGGGGGGGSGSGGNSGTIVSFHQAVMSAMKLSRSSSFHHGSKYKTGVTSSALAASTFPAPIGQSLPLPAIPPSQPKPKAKLKERTKVALKLYIIQQKVLALQTMVKELFDLTEVCRETEDAIMDDESCEEERARLEECQENFLRKVIDIETEVATVKKLVLFLCKHRIIEKHYG